MATVSGAWRLDQEFFVAMDHYEATHSSRGRAILDTISEAIDTTRDLLQVLPDTPVPVQGLIQALMSLIRLGVHISTARGKVYDFAKEIISWVKQIAAALHEHGGADKIADREMWDNIEELRDLIDEICAWAAARLKDSPWKFWRRFSIARTLAHFKVRLEQAQSNYRTVSIVVFSRRQYFHVQETRAIRDNITAQQLDTKQRTFLLDTLAPHIASNTSYTEQGKSKCAPDTRVADIGKVEQWAFDISDSAPRLCWITGDPGSGKSTLVTTLASTFRDSKILRAQYLFSRSHVSTTNPNNVFPSIASQLINDESPEVASVIHGALQQTPSLVDRISELQAIKIFVEPIQALSKARPLQNIIIVFDALDECEGQGKVVAEILTSVITSLPTNVRIMLSSRSEDVIQVHFSPLLTQRMAFSVPLTTSNSAADVSLFFKRRLEEIMLMNRVNTQIPDWRQKIGLEDLCKNTSGLFIWAVTAANFIQQEIDGLGSDAIGDMLTELKSWRMEDINNLYSTILERNCPKSSHPWVFERFRRVVGCICTLQEPLPLGELKSLLNLSIPGTSRLADVDHFVRRFRTVLVPGTEDIDDATVPRLHLSFVEFITNCDRVQRPEFHISMDTSHAEVAALCFDQLSTLRRDMCGIEHLATFNDNIPDLKSRVDQCLPRALRYACRFWSSHLPLAGQGALVDSSRNRLLCFLESHLLHWIESTSLFDFNSIFLSLETANDWAQRTCNDSRYAAVKDLLFDALRFTAMFSDAISQSAPHVYISALPFAPKSSRIYKQYRSNLKGCTVEVRRGLQDWLTYNWRIQGHNWDVNAVCFSPNGIHIASGSDDKTIQIWTAASGQRAGPPLQGHSEQVRSIAFSPDGKRLVSGSRDKIIRLWDVEHGRINGDPLTGHEGKVHSVAFSHDGRMIVSGSEDCTIRRWDALTRLPIGLPIKGHTGEVRSVAFSPDNAQIVSGSDDKAVRRWDAQSGEALGEPMLGHADQVLSVAVSPNGRLIASGSGDITVRLWHAADGQPFGSPLQGHSGQVSSVAFSPDSTRLVSGSWDRTVCLWDVASMCVVGTFVGLHSDWIRSVAFSPNGKQIVSCSDAGTICLTDAMGFTEASTPPEGHSEQVNCAAFSASGRLVASGSEDKTVCVWDAADRRLIRSFDTGDVVRSIAFSPDETRLATGGRGGAIRIWAADTGLRIGQPLVGHTDWINDLSFSPDGKLIVSGSNDRTLRLWDAETGRPVGDPLIGHEYWITCVAFSPDGAQIASGSIDETIRRWNVHSSQQIDAPIAARGAVSSVAFVPGTTMLVSESWGNSEGRNLMRVWDMTSGELTATLVNDYFGSAYTGGEMASSQQAKYSDYFALTVSGRWLRTADTGALVTWLPPALFDGHDNHWAYYGTKVAVGADNGSFTIIDIRCLNSEPPTTYSASEGFKWTSRSRFYTW